MKWGQQPMTRENKLPILRQGSRTCETKKEGGQEGGELEDEKNKGMTIEMEMRGAMREDKLGAGMSHGDKEDGNSEVGTTTKIKKNNNKNKKEDGGVVAQTVEVGSGGESESMAKGKATWGILERVGNHRARPPERGDLWEGIYGDVGNLRMKRGPTKSESGQTQEAATKSGVEESMQPGRATYAGAIADMGWGTTLLDRQADMGQASSRVLVEIYEGRTIYSMSAGSITGRHWLWRMANERRNLNEKEVGTTKPGG